MKRLLAITLLAVFALAGHAAAYSISLSPASQNVTVGNTATVDVNLTLSGTEMLNGFNLALGFNPALLGFSAFNTSLLNPADPLDPAFNYIGGFTYDPNLDPATLFFNGYVLDPTAAFSANITIASIAFSALDVGASSLQLSGDLDLGNPVLDPAAALASVTGDPAAPAPVPEPGTVLLLGLGLAGIVGCRKRLRKS